MSTKRKRIIDSPVTETPHKKRKGRITNAEKQKIHEELKKARDVFEKLKRHRGAENRDVTEHFIRAPSRRTDPEYYKLVKTPIDLTRIQQKLKTEEYHTFEEFCNDVQLLVDNTRNYYKEDQEEYQDISILQSLYKDAKDKVEKGIPLSDAEASDDEDDRSSAASSMDAQSVSSGRASQASADDEIDGKMIDDILCGVLELTDNSGRLLSPPFRVLKPKEEFQIYYEKIQNPIDLKTIATRGRAGEYKYMRDLETDIRLLCKNAQTFSGKNSDIYKDASAIYEFFKEKRDTVLEKGVHNKRREKCGRIVDELLAQRVSDDSNEYSEDSEEDEDKEDYDDMWRLYWSLRNEPDDGGPKGTCLSDPFLELPERSCYPDYYEDIKNPMSFFMINRKLKTNAYSEFIELVKDCMQIFENACEYNMDGSEYYVKAKKLEQLAVKKVRALQPALDLSMFDKQLGIVRAKPTPKAKSRAIKVELIESSSDEKEMSTPPPKKKTTPRKQKPISTGMSAEHMSTPGRPGRKSMDELMLRFRQKLVMFWDLLHKYKEEGEYWPIGAFMELPKARDFPDYYEVIAQPIDMSMIRKKIENNVYESSDQLMEDFKIMFSNAREYNQPGSDIHRDALRLENMVLNAHANAKESPYESPVCMKQKLGWLKTKLTEKNRKKTMNGSINSCQAMSDDDSSNSSVRSPAPSLGRTPRKDDKFEKMIARCPPDQQRMWRLFQFMRDYKDDEGRKLSTKFLRLPTRDEFPSYYEVIKKPMDYQRIQQRLNGQGYGTWSDLVADMGLMLDNACKFNEPGSQIYKDAVALQRVLVDKKRDLGAAEENIPRVQTEIRAMFMNIFAAVFSKKDADGCCHSDSFAELPEILKQKGVPRDEWPFTFDQIKRNIDKCRYRRLDRFQKDFFDLFEKARQCAKINSRLYEDAIELQRTFVQERDHHCKSSFISNAFAVIENQILEDIEIERKKRLHNGESHDQRRESTDEIADQEGEVDLDVITINDIEYTTGSYVYVSRTDDNTRGLPHIMRIERIFRNENGDNMIRGLWVYRPNETLHLPSRKFIENEVFLTPFNDVVLAERLQGVCSVVSLKTFLNNEIEGCDSKDLFVCESKYCGKPRYFLKMKNWPYPDEEERLKMVPRSRPISPIRIVSEFIKADSEAEMEDQSSQTSSSSEEDDRLRDSVVLDIERHEVPTRAEADADGRRYFYQILAKGGRHYACGDFVLVFNPQRPYCDVMRIDKIWREADGSEWFSGGWFARPSDVTHDRGRMFYTREVFAVIQSDQTRRVDDIQTHCAVMQPKDYIKMRPTEVPECDVFVCESKISGQPLPPTELCSFFQYKAPLANSTSNVPECDDYHQPGGEPLHIDTCAPLRKLKNYRNGTLVVDAEWFLFKTPISMEKVMSPLIKNDVAVPLDPLDMDMLDENDTDGAESVASSKPEVNNTNSNWLAAQPKLTAKSKSGYILFSAEIRKRIMHENPDAGFGEVSKIVGIEWKKLSDEQKKQYEVRAEYIATERAKQEAIRNAQKEQLLPGQIRVYQCRWSNCDSQFDVEAGLYEHIVQHHTSQIILDSDNQYVCMWVTCLRNRRDGKPFPSLPRLHRHMKEKHLGSSQRNLNQNQLGRNFFKLVTTSNSNGDNFHLVHCPFGRGAGLPTPTGNAATPQHQPHVNGHHHHPVMNGDHHPHHMASPAPHLNHPQSTQMTVIHHHQPSTSQHPQQMTQAHMNGPQPGPSHQQQIITDPGRTVVKLPPSAEPVFVHAPSSFMSRRALHSETYLRYIESLGNNRQRTVTQWEKSLTSNARNTQPNPKKPAPAHWIRQIHGRESASDEEVSRALWRLRDQLLESCVGIEREYTGTL